MTIQVPGDETTAAAVLERLGSNQTAHLNQLATQIWEGILQCKLFLKAIHVPGKENVKVGRASRLFVDRYSWKLSKTIFQQIDNLWDPHEGDLCAYQTNFQLAQYVSWKQEGGQFGGNKCPIAGLDKMEPSLCIPSFCPDFSCVENSKGPKLVITWIAPDWPTQTWFPELQRLCQESPMHIPRLPSLRTNHLQQVHPLVESRQLRLLACSNSI
jgi:hypothetical protein